MKIRTQVILGCVLGVLFIFPALSAISYWQEELAIAAMHGDLAKFRGEPCRECPYDNWWLRSAWLKAWREGETHPVHRH